MNAPMRFVVSENGRWSTEFEVTRTTSHVVRFFNRELDGDSLYLRRMRWSKWWAEIANGSLRIVGVSPSDERRIRQIAKVRVSALEEG